jgi:hypothetical protein
MTRARELLSGAWRISAIIVVLTTPDGGSVWIETDHIQMIRPPHGHCAPHSQALIRFDNGGTLCVREPPRQIEEMEHSGVR